MSNKILHFDDDDDVTALIHAVIEESYDDLELKDILDILNDSRTLRELGIYCGSNAILVNARRFIQNKIDEELVTNSVLQEAIAENVNIWKELGENHVLVLDFNDNSVTRLTENDLISIYGEHSYYYDPEKFQLLKKIPSGIRVIEDQILSKEALRRLVWWAEQNAFQNNIEVAKDREQALEIIEERIDNTSIEKKEFRNSVLIQLEAPQFIKSLKAMKVVVRSLTKKSAQYRKS